MNKALAAAVILAGTTLTGNTFAGSIIMLGDDQASVSSIIKLGEPDPCADNACGSEKVIAADAEPSAPSGSALVDQFGMPTNMPVVMRPSVDTAPVDASAPAAAAPVAAAPAVDPAAVTPQTPAPEPVKVEPAPEQVPVEGQPVAQPNQPVKEG